ncbi:unnamed protein product [Nesidiocoris tenuis]|uniref:Secreted protein n=1 Tax=Nesidiocoris tenuis TaxID=355587 RepID=A0A6H5HQP1_9HEMI|nr:unnamed protein product [Nesidiocoris tenuis]
MSLTFCFIVSLASSSIMSLSFCFIESLTSKSIFLPRVQLIESGVISCPGEQRQPRCTLKTDLHGNSSGYAGCGCWMLDMLDADAE